MSRRKRKGPPPIPSPRPARLRALVREMREHIDRDYEERPFVSRHFVLDARPPLRFDEAARDVMADAMGDVARRYRYHVHACAMTEDRAHLLVGFNRPGEYWRRRATDTKAATCPEGVAAHLAEVAAEALHRASLVGADAPVWAGRPRLTDILLTDTGSYRARRRIEQMLWLRGITPRQYDWTRQPTSSREPAFVWG